MVSSWRIDTHGRSRRRNNMSTKTNKAASAKKPQVKINDMKPKKDAKGGFKENVKV